MTAATGTEVTPPPDDPDRVLRALPPGIAILGVLALVALVFAQTLTFRFVYDDGWTIVSNGFLRVPDLGVLLGPEAPARHVPDATRPVQVLADIFLYKAVGLNAPVFHAASLGLHLAVCVALERWLAGLGASTVLRVCAVALFGVSAVHGESIAVVSFREDLLAALFGLVAMVAANRALDAPQRVRAWRWSVGAVLAMTVACGAKLSAAPIPALWWLARTLSPWRPPSPPWRRNVIAGALVMGVGLVVLHRLAIHGGLSPAPTMDGDPAVLAHRIGWAPVLARSLQIHLLYLQQLVVPWGLSPEIPDRGAAGDSAATLLSGAALLALAALGSWAAVGRRRPLLALAILGTMVLALPTSNLFPLRNMAAQRYLYLPSIPAYVGLAAGCLVLGNALARWTGAPLGRVVPVAVLALVHASTALATTRSYRAEGPLWATALRKAPGSSRAHAVTGLLELSRLRHAHRAPDPGLLPRIRAHCQNATRLDPQDPLAHLCRARLAVFERRWGPAHAAFGRARELGGIPADRLEAALAEVTLDLDATSAESGSDGADFVQQSTLRSARALREYPYSADLHASAARIHHKLGHPARARALIRRARTLRPERWELAVQGLELAMDLGDTPAAETAWRRDEPLLRAADPTIRHALADRLQDAKRLFPPVPQTSPAIETRSESSP